MRTLRVTCSVLLVIAAAIVVTLLACSPSMIVDTVIDAKSCTNNAHTMTFEMHSNSAINGAIYDGGTPNVLGIRALYANGTSQNMTCVTELDNVMKNDKVQLSFHAGVTIQGTFVFSLSDLAFYQADWQSIGAPDCGPIQSPQYTVTYTPAPGSGAVAPAEATLTLAVSDPYPIPMSVVDLDLVQSPVALDRSLLDWDNANFNALPWQSAAPGGAILDAASPPLSINLPVNANGGVVLCRFISVYDGNEVRGIMQVHLDSPLATSTSSWGKVKALYR